MQHKATAPLLVLIGFMGAGKSTVGRLLASRLGCPFVDLDLEIANIHGPIPDIFAFRGESGFRAIEYHHLDLILPKLERPSVLALGGGAFLQPANRELLASHSAIVIFLDASFDVVRERIEGTQQQRPLARDLDQLHRLYDQRRPTYVLADYTFDASASDTSELLTSLIQLSHRLVAHEAAHDRL